MKRFFCFLLFVSLGLCANPFHERIEDCFTCNSPIPSSWINPEVPAISCGQNGETYNITLCQTTLFTIDYCLITHNVTGTDYAGECGCPNHCMIQTGQGQCIGGSCECNPGWTGVDCSQVTCSNGDYCSNGICETDGEVGDLCECDMNWTGDDCTSEVPVLPPILPVVPSTQYDSWDKYGNNHPIFNNSRIAQIKFFMEESAVQNMFNPANRYTSDYEHADMYFNNGMVTKNMTNVGIRIKGNISRNFAKKTFKVSFNEFLDDDDNNWDQIDGFMLKGFQSDNAYLRDPLSTDVAYSMNAYIQRFGWAQIYINNQSYGYYLIIEEVDKHYLHSRFGTNDGPLYKCTANLTWIGPEPERYENLLCGTAPCYDAKTDEADDYTKLRDFLYVLNFSPDDTFAVEVAQVLDVDLFIRTFVWEVATGNWDGLRDTNNFYLFLNPGDGLWKYIRHDNDATFGALPVYQNVVTNDIYTWADDPHPTDGKFLYDRILATEIFKVKYSEYMQELFEVYFNPDSTSNFYGRAMGYQSMSSNSVLKDYSHVLDSGFTSYTFIDSYNTTFQKNPTKFSDGQLVMSIQSFMEQRISSAQTQINEFLKGY